MKYLTSTAPLGGRTSLALVAALCITVAVLYSLPVLVRFEIGGYLLDAGWFAFLFGSVDPMLQNPEVLNSKSFYGIHLSPIIYLWSLPISGLLGFSGIQSFALFHGVSVALASLGVGLCLLRSGFGRRHFIAALAVAAAFFVSNEFLLRATGYPHYEVVIVGLSTLLFVTSADRRWRTSLIIVFLLGISREDGGFYAAYIMCCVAVLNWQEMERRERFHIAGLFLLGLILSVISLLIQKLFFPGDSLFSVTFLGDNFTHVTLEFLSNRVYRLTTWAGIMPLLLSTALLGIFSRSYLVPFVLISPLLLLYSLSVRDVLGLFRLYYGLPFALIGVLMLIIYIRRSSSSKSLSFEGLAVCIMVASSSAAVSEIVGLERHSLSVFRELMFKIPEGSIVRHQDTIRKTLSADRDRVCGSIGVVALVPDEFKKGQLVTNADSDISACDKFLLFEGDMHYRVVKEFILRTGFEPESKAGKIEIYARSTLTEP